MAVRPFMFSGGKVDISDTGFGHWVSNAVKKVGDFFSDPSGYVSGAIGDMTHDTVESVLNPFIESLTGGRYENLADAFDVWTGEKANQDNLAYQREYNEQVFNRADTQYQRTVADLRAAGLSSQLAAGSPSTVSGASQAPQRTVGNESAAIERLVSLVNSIKSTKASTALAESQANKNNVEAAAYPYLVDSQIGSNKASAAQSWSQRDLNIQYANLAQIQGQTQAARDMATLQQTLMNTDYISKMIEIGDSTIRLNNANAAHSLKSNFLIDSQIKSNEASAQASYAGIRKVNAEIKYINKEVSYLSERIVTEAFNREYLNAETRNVLQNTVNASLRYVIDNYDFTFKKEKGDAPSSTEVSSTQVEQATKEFKRQLILKGVGSLTSVVTGAASGFGAALGLGGGKFFNKMLGVGETTLDPTSFIR